MLIGVLDTPVTWNISSNSSFLNPQSQAMWSSEFGELEVLDFRVQISTTRDFHNTRAHWYVALVIVVVIAFGGVAAVVFVFAVVVVVLVVFVTIADVTFFVADVVYCFFQLLLSPFVLLLILLVFLSLLFNCVLSNWRSRFPCCCCCC